EAPRRHVGRRWGGDAVRDTSASVGSRIAVAGDRQAGGGVFERTGRRFHDGENSGGGSHAFIQGRWDQGVARGLPARPYAGGRAEARGRAGKAGREEGRACPDQGG